MSELMAWAERVGPVERTDTVLSEVDFIDYNEREKYFLNHSKKSAQAK